MYFTAEFTFNLFFVLDWVLNNHSPLNMVTSKQEIKQTNKQKEATTMELLLSRNVTLANILQKSFEQCTF